MAIKKIAFYTDLHFGKKNNSETHNQDCLDFVDFFCNEVKNDSTINAIGFLGDLFESRSSINVATLNAAHEGLKKINNLGLPVYHCVGNHDLYHRTTRKVHSAQVFDGLKNFNIITEPTVIDDILFSPFLFKHEYPDLSKFIDVKYWAGHFEFRGFVVTGATNTLDHGPDHTQFKKPRHIITGHFHKRQIRDNVVYVGNCFPMDFGDADDLNRGMATLNTETEEMEFINWDNCPAYFKTSLSKVVNGEWIPREKSRIRCLLDMDITYNEAQTLKDEFISAFNLREFAIEENILEKKDAIAGGDDAVEEDLNLASIDEMVKVLLTKVTDTTTISANKLIEIYEEL